MVILRSQNKITDFLMILAWDSPFEHLIRDNSLDLQFFNLEIEYSEVWGGGLT